MTTLAFLSGCATPTPTPATPTSSNSTHLDLVNLSPCAWRIVFTDAADREAYLAHVPANATVTLALAPGDYTLTQTALANLPLSVSTRQFPASFAPGETYRWPLVTLLTGTAGSAP
ncbi:MAG: hypothetical protein H7343_21790 [Undibacterium sp.]|nr:hypothetical protein [Opitutaceae bacterium]